MMSLQTRMGGSIVTYDQAKQEALHEIGQTYHITIDRPIGSIHPKHPDIVYPINYGYIADLMGGDDEEQDVYVLDATEPLYEALVTIIAVIYRADDVETKWVGVVDPTIHYTDERIMELIHFQEQFYNSSVIRNL